MASVRDGGLLMRRAPGVFRAQPSVYSIFSIASPCLERVIYLRACAKLFTIPAIM